MPCLQSRSSCAVAVPLLWGYQFVAIKVGVTEFPPLFFLALRFLAIALLLVPFVKKPTRQQFGPIGAISIFLGGLNFGLFYVGLGLGSGSMSAVAYQLATPFTVLLAWPLLAERPSLTTSAGVVLAFVGVVVLAAEPGLSANALPLLLVVGAAFAFAVSNVLTKRYGPFDPLMLMGWSTARDTNACRFIERWGAGFGRWPELGLVLRAAGGPRSQVAEPQNVLRCANSDLELLAFLPQLLQLNQCSRNTPSTACSSAGLMSFECATVTAKSGTGAGSPG